MECELLFPCARKACRLQDRYGATIGSIDILPVQRPRHLDEVLSALLRVEEELLRIRKGDCGRLAHFGRCTHWNYWRGVVVIICSSLKKNTATIRVDDRSKTVCERVYLTCRTEEHLMKKLPCNGQRFQASSIDPSCYEPDHAAAIPPIIVRRVGLRSWGRRSPRSTKERAGSTLAALAGWARIR